MNASSRVKQQTTTRVINVPDNIPRSGGWIWAQLFEADAVLLAPVTDLQNLDSGRREVSRRSSVRGVLDTATPPGLGGGLDGRGFPCASIWASDWSFM